MTVRRNAVEGIIGEKLNGEPLDESERRKESCCGGTREARRGKGDVARAGALSPRRRKIIAKKAAKARWKS